MNYSELTCEELQNILENQIDYKLLVYDAKQEKTNLGLVAHRPSSSEFGYQSIYIENQNNYERKLKEIEELEPEVIPERLKFINVFDTLFYKSAEEDYYWEHCAFKVYKNTFDERFNAYKKINIDAELIDFAKEEQNKHMFKVGMVNFAFYITVGGNSFNTLLIEGFDTTKIDLALKKKREFLDEFINNELKEIPKSVNEISINDKKNYSKSVRLTQKECALLGRLFYDNLFKYNDLKPSTDEIANSFSNIFGYSAITLNKDIKGMDYSRFSDKEVNTLKGYLADLISKLDKIE